MVSALLYRTVKYPLIDVITNSKFEKEREREREKEKSNERDYRVGDHERLEMRCSAFDLYSLVSALMVGIAYDGLSNISYIYLISVYFYIYVLSIYICISIFIYLLSILSVYILGGYCL